MKFSNMKENQHELSLKKNIENIMIEEMKLQKLLNKRKIK